MANQARKLPINFTTVLSVLIFLILALGVGLFYFYNQSTDTQEDKGPVVATVNGEQIFKNDLDSLTGALIEVREPGSQDDLSDTQAIALEDLILEALLSQYLNDQGALTSDDEIKQEISTNGVDDTVYNFHFHKKRLFIQKVKLITGISNKEYFSWYRELRAKAEVEYLIDVETSSDSQDAAEVEEDKEEDISADEFSDWYLKLRKEADVTIYLDTYKEAGT